MIKTTITCDTCEKDLSESGPRTEYYLTLAANRVPSTSNMHYLVQIFPPIDRTMHFCGMGCLLEKFNPSSVDD